ncbi:oxidoreductase-like protein [Phycomyces nitens]|nr:oxidoreductase-like protein [Phycomyces nitens]
MIPLPIPTKQPELPELPDLADLPGTVVLKGQRIELPKKPESPDNCCMSGCAHCVWDMYQEDIEDYQAKRSAIRQKFEEAGEPVPTVLGRSNKSAAKEVEEAMDPTMRAFLEMERKMNKKV